MKPFCSVPLIVAFICLLQKRCVAMTENDRLDEYLRRGYNWPPDWNPATKGWSDLMKRREKQLMALPSAQARWDGWSVLVGSASLVKNFTEKGFAVAKAPTSVQQRLHDSLVANMDTARYEDTPTQQIDVIKGVIRPKFIDQEELNQEILQEMKPLFEEWSGVKLKPTIAYGLRIYQNGSSLLMHVDKVEDHVISAILHVGHEYDDENEPWPIVIESFDGSCQEVVLQPGEMLFYESAKCMHGRPRPFKGKYYSSIFIHYLPVDWNIQTIDNQIMVPPHWLDGLEQAMTRNGYNEDSSIPRLNIIGTGFEEPDCPDGWCGLKPRKDKNGFLHVPPPFFDEKSVKLHKRQQFALVHHPRSPLPEEMAALTSEGEQTGGKGRSLHNTMEGRSLNEEYLLSSENDFDENGRIGHSKSKEGGSSLASWQSKLRGISNKNRAATRSITNSYQYKEDTGNDNNDGLFWFDNSEYSSDKHNMLLIPAVGGVALFGILYIFIQNIRKSSNKNNLKDT